MAAHGANSVVHVCETASTVIALGIETATIVADLDMEDPGMDVNMDGGAGGFGMPADIVYRFFEREKNLALDRKVDPWHWIGKFGYECDAGKCVGRGGSKGVQ